MKSRAPSKTATSSPIPSLEDLQSAVRGVGLRSTPARIAVLKHFHLRREPQTHAGVAESLKPLGFDRTTVYRNLLELSEVGLLNRVEVGDHVWRFELGGSAAQPAHPHFLCVDCGAVACLDDEQADMRFPQFAKGNPIGEVTEVLFKGHCNQCR